MLVPHLPIREVRDSRTLEGTGHIMNIDIASSFYSIYTTTVKLNRTNVHGSLVSIISKCNIM